MKSTSFYLRIVDDFEEVFRVACQQPSGRDVVEDSRTSIRITGYDLKESRTNGLICKQMCK